jgi:hypothetical protein
LCERWAVTRAKQGPLLGLRSTSTLDNWRRRPPASLPLDTMERISYLLQIYGSLVIYTASGAVPAGQVGGAHESGREGIHRQR